MPYYYYNTDVTDEHALPDVEVYFLSASAIQQEGLTDEDGDQLEEGWYWQAGFPGCMPDGGPNGPFHTRAAALADAREE